MYIGSLVTEIVESPLSSHISVFRGEGPRKTDRPGAALHAAFDGRVHSEHGQYADGRVLLNYLQESSRPVCNFTSLNFVSISHKLTVPNTTRSLCTLYKEGGKTFGPGLHNMLPKSDTQAVGQETLTDSLKRHHMQSTFADPVRTHMHAIVLIDLGANPKSVVNSLIRELAHRSFLDCFFETQSPLVSVFTSRPLPHRLETFLVFFCSEIMVSHC